MSDPFDLNDSAAYQAWRAKKLADWPSGIDAWRVEVTQLAEPSRMELAAMGALIDKCNLALVDCRDPEAISVTSLLALGRRLGLVRLDANPCSNERGMSAIAVHQGDRAGEYIPYTDRPLSWHTDGYYNAPASAVRAWMLFCVRDAADGGENALLDPEIAYILLRDEDPSLIRALMEPDALVIPANRQGGVELRPASAGPVFSVIEGRLHMRYSARARNIHWKSAPALDAAREQLTRLLSQPSVYMFRHKLKPGEGYVSNNVLHNRTGFNDPTESGRLLLRSRYLDRIQTFSGRAEALTLPPAPTGAGART
jgi:hypothetical protein